MDSSSVTPRQLPVRLDGWMLDSGQIRAIKVGMRVDFALEVTSIRLAETASTSPEAARPYDLRMVAVIRELSHHIAAGKVR